jgi:hypothetical protein
MRTPRAQRAGGEPLSVNRKRKKVLIGLALLVAMAAVGMWLSGASWRRGDMAVRLVFVGYTNVGGSPMALFKVQNNQARRIWLRNGAYLFGEAFHTPGGAWECSMAQAISNRWHNSAPEPMIPGQYLPPEPSRKVPCPTSLMVPVPRDQARWRIGLTVEFEVPPLSRLQVRFSDAWAARSPARLMSDIFINNSANAIWTESPLMTNATVLSGSVAPGTRVQP